VHEAVSAVAAEREVPLGKVAQPLRVAVSGGAVSPPIDVTLEILGRATTLERLDRAIARAGA
jgi:glutamyl-tRNA synthetase